ncbi:hypothetical protein [Enterobacter ludwigii]
MNKRVNAYYCFIPIGIYAAYSLSVQFLFGVPFVAKSMVLSLIPSAIYTICFWKLHSSKRTISLTTSLVSNILLATILLFLICFVGKDTESALIAGIAVQSLMAFIFVGMELRSLPYRENDIRKGVHTGMLYALRSGTDHQLSSNEAQVLNFPEEVVNVRNSEINIMPINSPSNAYCDHGVTVNPSSGMPMIGGMSGLDIHGNSWGTNFNEPSNTYDPNRGY